MNVDASEKHLVAVAAIRKVRNWSRKGIVEEKWGKKEEDLGYERYGRRQSEDGL